jgi:membrane protein
MPQFLQTPVEFGRRLVDHVMKDDSVGLAAELAYRFFLAIFPFAIFLAALGGAVARALEIQNPAEQAVDLLQDALPEEAATLIGRELQNIVETEQAGLMSVGVLAALWFATGGTNTIIKAANRVYATQESRPFWKRYLLALGMTVLAGSAVVGAFVLFFAGQVIGEDFAGQIGLGEVWGIITILRWPLMVLLLIVAVSVLYRLAPSIKSPPRWVLPGAILFTVGWLVATALFGFYVANFADYAGTYGALAGVVILLIWFYMTAFLLLLGLEVNEVIAEMRDPEGLKRLRHQAGEEVELEEADQRRRPDRERRDPREERTREEEEGTASA